MSKFENSRILKMILMYSGEILDGFKIEEVLGIRYILIERSETIEKEIFQKKTACPQIRLLKLIYIHKFSPNRWFLSFLWWQQRCDSDSASKIIILLMLLISKNCHRLYNAVAQDLKSCAPTVERAGEEHITAEKKQM